MGLLELLGVAVGAGLSNSQTSNISPIPDYTNQVLDALAGVSDTNENIKPLSPSNVGGGLFNASWAVDNSTDSRRYEIDANRTYKTTNYSPTTNSFTIPIITITGSDVRDTGNTSTVQPNYFRDEQSTSTGAKSMGGDTNGLDIAGILIPVGIIGALVFGGVEITKAVLK